VIRRQQGAESVYEHLLSLFNKVEILYRHKGYYVIAATKEEHTLKCLKNKKSSNPTAKSTKAMMPSTRRPSRETIVSISRRSAAIPRFLTSWKSRPIRLSGSVEKGLDEVMKEVFPIANYANTVFIDYVGCHFEEPEYGPLECKEGDLTYSSKLKVTLRLRLNRPAKSKRTTRSSWAMSR
jgi:DNA-directed RNA polymerase beta subunit